MPVKPCVTVSFFRNDPSLKTLIVYLNLHKQAGFLKLTILGENMVRYSAEITPCNGSRGNAIAFKDLKDATGLSFDGLIREILVTSDLGKASFKVSDHFIK